MLTNVLKWIERDQTKYAVFVSVLAEIGELDDTIKELEAALTATPKVILRRSFTHPIEQESRCAHSTGDP